MQIKMSDEVAYSLVDGADTAGGALVTKEDILDYLSNNNEIFFKSQQIDDPELTVNEKKQIAAEIFDESHKKFLSRFGRFLAIEHLNFFQLAPRNENDDYEIQYLLRNFRESIQKRCKYVKNRRFTAMQTLIKENDYFSEKEMMRREPHLYEQLVGQYLTDTEKKARDAYDPKNTVFSKILLETFDKEQTEKLRKQQERDDTSDDGSENSFSSFKTNQTMNTNNDDLFPRTPPEFRKQWGNFEDEEESTSYKKTKTVKKQKYITAAEREMLRQEFIGIMHSKFLEGQDKDFDYSKVDNNPDLDDLKQIGQDDEDEYFNDDSEDEENEHSIDRMQVDEDSEDDLDLFMKHLNKHPTVQGNRDA